MQSILRDETVFLYRFSDISLKFWFSRQFYELLIINLFWRERTRRREGYFGRRPCVVSRNSDSEPDVSMQWYYRACEFLAIILWCVRTEALNFYFDSSRDQRWAFSDIIASVNSSPSFYDAWALRFRTDTGR